ncbi:MAG: G/U mismatch-specific DNA glycosylase [Acidobacteria bacterium]|nr:MAG: G/U mismatch-specific DNA glycosylase [Acidobacteriota bacterium]
MNKRPTKEELQAAIGKTVPDIIAPGLTVLFCGINPGLYTAAVGHHFARPGNRFWPALFAAGFTDRLLSPFEEKELLKHGCGITNLVSRATVAAAELDRAELQAGRRMLEEKISRFRPLSVAIVGLDAFRKAFDQPKAQLGRQEESLQGSLVWLLPNTSGLNAHHRPSDFARLFRELREAVRLERERNNR